ncbi:MAG TPA: DUF465 domain-containing protein [Thermodesulfobacteriota bacterium]|nr:DUF465 domain-containing protein [Thermodesulfobacteriota bacterium]
MDKKEKELVGRLLKENEEFRNVYTQHREYTKKVEKMEKKVVLTGGDEIEKKRLKKLKLAMKDMIEKIISEAR